MNPEYMIATGTSVSSKGPFTINPASLMTQNLEVNMLFLNNRTANKFSLENESIRTEGVTSTLGLAALSNLGSGLHTSFNYYQTSAEFRSYTDRNNNFDFIESIDHKLMSFSAAVDLTDIIVLGVKLQLLRENVDLLGSFDISPKERTQYVSQQFGSGAGLLLKLEKNLISAAYLPPMKGKAEIIKEEKVLTAPGMAEIAISFKNEPIQLGFAARRWLYKKDDRNQGTTLSNANNTAIDLNGLNTESNQLFLLDQKQIGLDYTLSQSASITTSLSINNVEHNESPEVSLPGENAQNKTYNFYRLQLFYEHKRNRFNLRFGGHLSRHSAKLEPGDFSAESKGLLIAMSSKI